MKRFPPGVAFTFLLGSFAFAVRNWMTECSSCHNSTSALAHIDVNTSANGSEACAVCHGEGDDLSVLMVHKIR